MATEADLIQKFKDLNIPVGADFEELIHAAFAGFNLADQISSKADDSKVVHNTGAEEVSGQKTFDTAPIDKTTGNPYITRDGVPDVPSTLADTTKLANFTAGLQSNGTSVATQTDVTADISTATANMADTTKLANFTAGLQSGGVDVATSADFNNYYHANASDDAALAAAKSATVPGIFWFEEV